MKTQILTAAVIASLITPVAFAQMGGGYSQGPSQVQQPNSGPGTQTTTTKTKTVMPVGVKGYLDSQMASSKDKRFHADLNGKDLPLTLVKIYPEQKAGNGTSTAAADMKGSDGKVYQITFVLSGGVVTRAAGIKVKK